MVQMCSWMLLVLQELFMIEQQVPAEETTETFSCCNESKPRPDFNCQKLRRKAAAVQLGKIQQRALCSSVSYTEFEYF